MKYAAFMAAILAAVLTLQYYFGPKDHFEIIRAEDEDAVLILFPEAGGTVEGIKEAFHIEEVALTNGLSVILMDFNEPLLEHESRKALKKELEGIFRKDHLSTSNVFLGGFSSGGNVSLLMCDYLMRGKSTIKPKGVFAADAPVDLMGAYAFAKQFVKDHPKDTLLPDQESLVKLLESKFGAGEESTYRYEESSPFTMKTGNIQNLMNLNGVQVRLYTEPDTVWWEENYGIPYGLTNSYYIKELAALLAESLSASKVEYIATTMQGIRSNGIRHPHSWSIVEEHDLVKWIKENTSNEYPTGKH